MVEIRWLSRAAERQVRVNYCPETKGAAAGLFLKFVGALLQAHRGNVSVQRFWPGRKNMNTINAAKARHAAARKALAGCNNHNAAAISDAGR